MRSPRHSDQAHTSTGPCGEICVVEDAQIAEALREAVTPIESDVMAARAVVIEALRGGSL